MNLCAQENESFWPWILFKHDFPICDFDPVDGGEVADGGQWVKAKEGGLILLLLLPLSLLAPPPPPPSPPWSSSSFSFLSASHQSYSVVPWFLVKSRVGTLQSTVANCLPLSANPGILEKPSELEKLEMHKILQRRKYSTYWFMVFKLLRIE